MTPLTSLVTVMVPLAVPTVASRLGVMVQVVPSTRLHDRVSSSLSPVLGSTTFWVVVNWLGDNSVNAGRLPRTVAVVVSRPSMTVSGLE